MDKNKTKLMDTLDTLTDALGTSEGQSTEEIVEELRGEGIDVDGALKRLKMTRKSIAMKAKRSALDLARIKRIKHAESGHRFLGRFKDWSKEQVIDRIKELSGPRAGLAYRDLEKMNAEEIKAILEDLEMAKAIAREEDSDEK